MTTSQVFILHCAISASVRQSIQIAFEDYKLPPDVVETLKEANTISIRPNLSQALKKNLDELRVMQRFLYDRFTIHHGDVHFIHPDHFEEAKACIDEIKEHASICNARMREAWPEELAKWEQTIVSFFTPLFPDEDQLRLVKEAYMRFFPRQKEFENPIRVDVVGPYPAVLERCDDPTTIEQVMSNEAAINTEQVLEAAKDGAIDHSLGKVASLLDDLDARPAHKVTGRVIADNKKQRGAWRKTAQELSLAATHNPLLTEISTLCDDLLSVAELMNDPNSGNVRTTAFKRYTEVRQAIADEAAALLKKAGTSEGYEALQKSVAMTGCYHNLVTDLGNCSTIEELNVIRDQIDTETSVYKHRAKNLEKLLSKAQERMAADVAIARCEEELKQVLNDSNKIEADF